MLMRRYIINPLLSLFLLTGCVSAAQVSSVSPHPKKSNITSSTVSVGPSSTFSAPEAFRNAYRTSMNALTDRLSQLPASKENRSILIEIAGKTPDVKSERDSFIIPDHREGYAIEIRDDLIRVTGADMPGALHGMTTLEQMIRNHNGLIPQGHIIDWPDHTIRALHLVLRAVDPSVVRDIIRAARYAHYNCLILDISDGIRFSSAKDFVRDDAWSKEQFMDIIDEARQNGLEIIPEIKLLTHQEKLFKRVFPHLMYNKSTYDPRKEEVYARVYRMIDEVIGLVKPKAFHIGHDEVAGHGTKSREKWLKKGESMLPPDLFLQDVLKLHGYLKEKEVATWMWGDMLISAKEFPTMMKNHLHGTDDYVKLRSLLPKDIVICDWHYSDSQAEFPSILAFAEAGHPVLGATWKKEKTIRNFSSYVYRNRDRGSEGMIATIWYFLQRNNLDTVSTIMRTSAEAFWNAQ